jgi:hypothetical protein
VALEKKKKTVCAFFISLLHAVCPADLILSDVIIQTVSAKGTTGTPLYVNFLRHALSSYFNLIQHTKCLSTFPPDGGIGSTFRSFVFFWQ